MNNLFVISYDAGYDAPYGAARFADLDCNKAGIFTYFKTYDEACGFILDNNGTLFYDDTKEA